VLTTSAMMTDATKQISGLLYSPLWFARFISLRLQRIVSHIQRVRDSIVSSTM
jgi:hypothetical protein